MTYALLSLITLAGIIIYLDIRICKLERYIRWYTTEIAKLNYELNVFRIKLKKYVQGK